MTQSIVITILLLLLWLHEQGQLEVDRRKVLQRADWALQRPYTGTFRSPPFKVSSVRFTVYWQLGMNEMTCWVYHTERKKASSRTGRRHTTRSRLLQHIPAHQVVDTIERIPYSLTAVHGNSYVVKNVRKRLNGHMRFEVRPPDPFHFLD